MLYKLVFMLFIILMAIDGITTFKIINDGGQELNPIVDGFIKLFGLVIGLVVIKGLAIAFIAWVVPHISVIVILNSVYIWVCWKNIEVVKTL